MPARARASPAKTGATGKPRAVYFAIRSEGTLLEGSLAMVSLIKPQCLSSRMGRGSSLFLKLHPASLSTPSENAGRVSTSSSEQSVVGPPAPRTLAPRPVPASPGSLHRARPHPHSPQTKSSIVHETQQGSLHHQCRHKVARRTTAARRELSGQIKRTSSAHVDRTPKQELQHIPAWHQDQQLVQCGK